MDPMGLQLRYLEVSKRAPRRQDPTRINEQANDLGVSKNRGTPKWMVYNGKAY